MPDEVDTTTRWRCPKCGQVLEDAYDQIQLRIVLHERKCPEKETTNESPKT